jgi:hypothetical protein
VLSFASRNPSREYLPELVYPKYSIESISLIFITDCILGMRNRQISERCDYGYKSNLLKKFTFRSLISNFLRIFKEAVQARYVNYA